MSRARDRYARPRYEAEILAWVLDRLGLKARETY
jgi:hypothetical protein